MVKFSKRSLYFGLPLVASSVATNFYLGYSIGTGNPSGSAGVASLALVAGQGVNIGYDFKKQEERHFISGLVGGGALQGVLSAAALAFGYIASKA